MRSTWKLCDDSDAAPVDVGPTLSVGGGVPRKRLTWLVAIGANVPCIFTAKFWTLLEIQGIILVFL